MSCGIFTKTAQSSGPENIGIERPLAGHVVPGPVLSPSRIALENNGKIRPQPDRENAFAGATGGGDGPDVEPSPLKPLIYLTSESVSNDLRATLALVLDSTGQKTKKSAFVTARFVPMVAK